MISSTPNSRNFSPRRGGPEFLHRQFRMRVQVAAPCGHVGVEFGDPVDDGHSGLRLLAAIGQASSRRRAFGGYSGPVSARRASRRYCAAGLALKPGDRPSNPGAPPGKRGLSVQVRTATYTKSWLPTTRVESQPAAHTWRAIGGSRGSYQRAAIRVVEAPSPGPGRPARRRSHSAPGPKRPATLS